MVRIIVCLRNQVRVENKHTHRVHPLAYQTTNIDAATFSTGGMYGWIIAICAANIIFARGNG